MEVAAPIICIFLINLLEEGKEKPKLTSQLPTVTAPVKILFLSNFGHYYIHMAKTKSNSIQTGENKNPSSLSATGIAELDGLLGGGCQKDLLFWFQAPQAQGRLCFPTNGCLTA